MFKCSYEGVGVKMKRYIHLKMLKNTGLIVSRRDGKEIYYRLADTLVAEHIHRICEEIFQITCPLE